MRAINQWVWVFVVALCSTAGYADEWDNWKQPGGCIDMYQARVDAATHTMRQRLQAYNVKLLPRDYLYLVMVVNPADRWEDGDASADFRGFSGGHLALSYSAPGSSYSQMSSPVTMLTFSGQGTGSVYLYCQHQGNTQASGSIRVRFFLFRDWELASRFYESAAATVRPMTRALPARPGPAGGATGGAASGVEASPPTPEAPFIEQPPAFPADFSATPFARRRSSVSGLVVQDTAAGFVGSRMEIIGIVAPHAGDGRARLMRSVGSQMTTSFEEALRTVRVDYPRWEPGELQVSFSDKYSPKDGGSAGAAFAVLVSSMLEGFEVDSQYAMTGDITVDGKVRAVGAVGAKIRGAVRDGMKVVAVPAENADVVADFAVLEGIDEILGTQVIAVQTLAEAVALARADRSGPTAEAITLFASLEMMSGRGAGRPWQPSMESVATLEKVLELCPQHLSADLALKAAKNELPRTLSAASSINEAFIAIRPIAPDELEEKLRNRMLDRQVVTDIKARLRRIQILAHPKARGLIGSIMAYVNQVELASRRSLSSEAVEKINRTLREIGKEAESIGADRDLLEEILN